MEFKLLLLFVIGILTGFINILAGGGSLITLPLLIFLGLPGSMANGTNRVAILIQNLAAIMSYRQLNIFPWRPSLLAVPPALLGTYIGATLAVNIPDHLFKPMLAAIMVGITFLIWLDPAHRWNLQLPLPQALKTGLFLLAFFFIGLYGGFIQAGIGFLLITVLLISGFDMVTVNAIKILVVFVFTILALGIFIWHGQVNFAFGLALGLGSALGGFIGTRVAVKKGHEWVKGFVIVMVILFAIKLVWDTWNL